MYTTNNYIYYYDITWNLIREVWSRTQAPEDSEPAALPPVPTSVRSSARGPSERGAGRRRRSQVARRSTLNGGTCTVALTDCCGPGCLDLSVLFPFLWD